MGSCSSKPGEVGSMPQEGSGSAAPMDPAAIEAVRATSSSRKQPLASPERPVTPYDRRVVSHDASRPTPSSRSPLAREPFEGEGTSPPRRGARLSATHGAMASSSAAHLAAMTHGDAWPPPLEGERARDPSRASAETESPTFSRFPEATETRAADDAKADERARDASVVVYSLDGTVSTVRVPPVASPGDQSHAPSDRALQGLGSRLGAKKHALPLGRLPGSRPVTGERGRSRPTTREGGRVTASEVMDAMAGVRAAVVETNGAESDGAEEILARRERKSPFKETFSDAFPEPSGAAFAFGADDSDASSSDDEPTETLAMARERARLEERASAEKAAADRNAEREARDGRDDDLGDDDGAPPPPRPPRPESRPESRVLDFATDAPRLRMATLATGPAPRPVSREAGRMPPPPPWLPKKEASPLKPSLQPPLRAPADPAPAATATSAEASSSPRRETPPGRDEKKAKKKAPLEEELEAWGVSLPDSEASSADGGGDLVAVDDEDDDLLSAFGAADFSAASESPAPFATRLADGGPRGNSFCDLIPESPLVTSPLEERERLSSSPLFASPAEVSGEKEEETNAFRVSPETKETSPPRDALSGSSADENAPLTIGDAEDAESLAWLRKTSRDAETAARRTKIPPGGVTRAGDEHSGVLRETPLRAETVAAYGAASVKRESRVSRRKSKIPPPPSPSLRRESSAERGPEAEAESVEGKSAKSEKRSAWRLANPKSRLPPPPTRRDVEKAAAKAPASSRRVSSVAGQEAPPAKSAGTRLASTTAAGYSAGAAGRTEKARKPTKPKGSDSRIQAPPAARPASTASDAPRDAKSANTTPNPAEPEERRRRTSGRSADPGSVPVPTDAPAATPAEPKTDSPASAPPAMTKAEEARARLRGSRQRRSIAGVASSVASSVSASSATAVAPSAPPAAPPAAAQAPPKPAGAAEWGSDPAAAAAAAAAASKLASKLGSVSVMKPRGSTSSKESAAEKAERRAADAARRAEHAAAFARAAAEAEAAKAAAAAAAKEAAAREAEHRVAGVDEAEMVLRVGSLADEKTLVGARQAVHRMRALLDDVTRLSRELKCEPQHVYGHVLHRLGFPVDRESRELPLERAVGIERAREMCLGVSELRNLLRIKVQDNNDLRLAQTALLETTAFFERLDAFAKKKNKTPSEVLAAQANGGVA